jgi:DNA modification methylase
MASSNGLMKLSKATAYLAQCVKIEDAIDLRDKAKAVESFAKASKQGLEAQNYAAEIRIRAERRAGQLLKEMEAEGRKDTGKGGNRKSATQSGKVIDKPKTTAELGLERHEPSRFKDTAELDDKEFEAFIVDTKEKKRELTTSEARKRGKAKKRNAKKAEEAKSIQESKATQDHPDWKIVNGDCLKELKGISGARLVFADPPYNIGIDYGQGTTADNLPPMQYLKWCQRWIKAATNCLTNDGSFWILVCDEYAEHFAVMMAEVGLVRRAWIKWYETFGVNCSHNFNRTSRHLFYYVRNQKSFVFNTSQVSQQSARQTTYNDSRANASGKNLDDVWQIPRLVGTAEERIPGFPTQLPLELMRRVVECASMPGDLIVDPFCGSATTGIAAMNHGCRFVGIEKEKSFVALAKKRMQKNE